MQERRMMKYGLGQVGVVVVMDKAVASGLRRMALRYGWPLIHLPTATQAAKTIGRNRVDIAVVHMAVELQQAVELVRWLRMTREDALVIAVASPHDADVERRVRQAGAHCYLPQDDEVSLERAIIAMILQEPLRSEPNQTTATHSRLKQDEPTRGRTARQGA